MMTTPEPWNNLLDELAIQRECLDMMSAAWVADYRSHGGSIFCGRGCRECCSLTVNCTLTEAVALAPLLNDSQAKAVAEYAVRLSGTITTVTDLKGYLRMQRRDMGWCPLLEVDGACGVYAQRPLSCRALLSTKESFYCGVDFADLTSEEKQAYVESLDRSVTDFPLHYVASTRETGGEMEARSLTLMRQKFGFSLYGNMPVLVYLVREKCLAEAVLLGRPAVEDVAMKAGLAHPFLVDFGNGDTP
jgi:Fe-S-cluster containining protein